MGINNLSINDYQIFQKKIIINDIYDINIQFNSKFCKIRICYNNISNLCMVKDLKKSFPVYLALLSILLKGWYLYFNSSLLYGYKF
jgi:hypothetical protein